MDIHMAFSDCPDQGHPHEPWASIQPGQWTMDTNMAFKGSKDHRGLLRGIQSRKRTVLPLGHPVIAQSQGAHEPGGLSLHKVQSAAHHPTTVPQLTVAFSHPVVPPLATMHAPLHPPSLHLILLCHSGIANCGVSHSKFFCSSSFICKCSLQ